jgi:hypothetical protein
MGLVLYFVQQTNVTRFTTEVFRAKVITKSSWIHESQRIHEIYVFRTDESKEVLWINARFDWISLNKGSTYEFTATQDGRVVKYKEIKNEKEDS